MALRHGRARTGHSPHAAILFGVEHRIEKVRVFQGVTYINDSKGTNVDSTIKAVQSMKAPTVLLLGGYDKHTDFMPLCREIIASGRIDDVVVMGRDPRARSASSWRRRAMTASPRPTACATR